MKRRIIVGVGVSLVVIPFGYWLYIQMRPTKTIVNPPAQEREEVIDVQTNIEKRSRLIRFIYPSTFSDVADTTATNTNALEQFTLNRRSSSGFTRIIISVKTLETVIEEESSYVFRTSRPAIYEQRRVALGPHEYMVFSSNEQAEIVAYMHKDDRLLTISCTTSADRASLEPLLESVGQSIQWL